MSLYTLQQLSDQIDALTSRVNTLDGQNLSQQSSGAVPQLVLQINSVKTDLTQLVANFENQLSIILTQLNGIQAQINTLTGVPNTQ